MPPPIHSSRWPRRWLIWLAAGLVLRLIFIYFPRPGDDDTIDYLQMGHNLFHFGIYGTGTGDDLGPSTYRLPAYPIFLATFEFLFARFWPNTWLMAVYLFQTIAAISPIAPPKLFSRWPCSAPSPRSTQASP
jgi:hypothetical protein